MKDLVVRKRGLPDQSNSKTRTIWTHIPDLGELLIHHNHMFSQTDTACTQSKLSMISYQGGVHTVGLGIGIILLGVTNITSNIHLNNAT